jgi:hypothetical protein
MAQYLKGGLDPAAIAAVALGPEASFTRERAAGLRGVVMPGPGGMDLQMADLAQLASMDG